MAGLRSVLAALPGAALAALDAAGHFAGSKTLGILSRHIGA